MEELDERSAPPLEPRRRSQTPIPYLRAGYVLYNKERRMPYLWRSYKTEAEARWVLADLLRPYPKKHAWRRCIRLAFYYGPPILVGKSRKVTKGIRLLSAS